MKPACLCYMSGATFFKSNFVFPFHTLVAVLTKPALAEGLVNQESLDLVEFPLTNAPKHASARAREAESNLLISELEFGLN